MSPAAASHAPPPTVAGVRTRTVLVPFARPLATKVGYFERWPLVLIDLDTVDGPTGHAYLAPYRPEAAAALRVLVDDLGDKLTGAPATPRAVATVAGGLRALAGEQGLALAAQAGLDMAAWDVVAKDAGRPLAHVLGGELAPVPAYNSNGLGLNDPDTLATETAELIAEGGFSALKVRVGRDRPDDDLRAIRTVREAAGPDATLVADYNQGLDLAAAIPRCAQLDGEGLAWIEEPLRYDDLDGHARLARDTTTPIMLGENFYGPKTLLEAVHHGACDLVMPDLMRIGGVTGWLAAAAMADATRVPMSSHLYPEISSHLMAVTPTGAWLEWQDWAHPILADPFPVRDGHVHPPNVPGNGLAWDEAAVARHLVAP
ncbi:enolase C-terminal domain-like protein [Actinomycetospora flava]|uniref:Enolase C-terminal domain-like protein n=1 Tax=Actinomycetospora flava TaxID=3129232 RepID=A0ABU8MBQ6_9PSEU